ncbi:hypothetical protein IFM89_038312, partial [Coptis chinensis]
VTSINVDFSCSYKLTFVLGLVKQVFVFSFIFKLLKTCPRRSLSILFLCSLLNSSPKSFKYPVLNSQFSSFVYFNFLIVLVKKMKVFPGTPGTYTGLALRILQCLLAAGSIASMATTTNFFSYTAFCYLIASMGLQVLWSFGLAWLDAYALAKKTVIHNPVMVSLFVVGDWVTAILSLAAASSSAGLTVLFFRDLGTCIGDCSKYQFAVALAFLSWVMIAVSSLIMFWILATG